MDDSRAIGERMYEIRLNKDAQVLNEIGKLIKVQSRN